MLNRILWLGPMASAYALKKHLAINQAACKYSWGLLQGLRDNGVDVAAISHMRGQSFPLGPFWPGSREDFAWNGLEETIHYPNIKGVRDFWLSWRYVAAARRLFARKPIDAVVCYNALHPYHEAVMKTAQACGKSCFPIILDGNGNDPRQDQWGAIRAATQHATGIVFASNWMARNYPGEKPVLHMDSGCCGWFGDEAMAQTDSNLIVYAGGLDQARGLPFLVEVVRRLRNPAWRIAICGKCDQTAIRKLFDDPRVEVKGLVSDDELHLICLQAAVFLNLRDPNLPENIVNFPSKVPNYLSYGKPVISTWIDSFSDDYRDHLLIVENLSPDTFADAFAAKVTEVMTWSVKERQIYCANLRNFVCQDKLWVMQSRRMLDWMSRLMK